MEGGVEDSQSLQRWHSEGGATDPSSSIKFQPGEGTPAAEALTGNAAIRRMVRGSILKRGNSARVVGNGRRGSGGVVGSRISKYLKGERPEA